MTPYLPALPNCKPALALHGRKASPVTAANVATRIEPWLALIEKRCGLLAEDRRFIRLRLATRQPGDAMQLAEGYSAAWEQAAMQEQRTHVKNNAGRQAANRWLKRQLEQ